MSKKLTYIYCSATGIIALIITLASGIIEKITGHSGKMFLNYMLLMLVLSIATTAVVLLTQRNLPKEQLIRTAVFGFLWALLALTLGATLVAVILYLIFNNSRWAFG
jgi:hypothetical protein